MGYASNFPLFFLSVCQRNLGKCHLREIITLLYFPNPVSVHLSLWYVHVSLALGQVLCSTCVADVTLHNSTQIQNA